MHGLSYLSTPSACLTACQPPARLPDFPPLPPVGRTHPQASFHTPC